MKAISLTQPWASFVVHGLKQIETRSWRHRYTGLLAIHASKGMPAAAVELCYEEPHRTLLASIGIAMPHDLPRGVVLGTVELVDYLTTVRLGRPQLFGGSLLSEQELALGDYSPGRWMWLLRNATRLDEPVPARGSLGLWEWEPEAALMTVNAGQGRLL